MSAVEILPEGPIGIVELSVEHSSHIHQRDAPTPAMLEKFGIAYCAVMVDHESRPVVFTEHDVGGIAEWRSIEPVRMDLGTADDCIRRVIVPRFQSRR